MADTIVNKPSIQIRSGLPSPLPDKSPSPATKLLISHGKPNFTISRSPNARDNNANPLSPQPNANNNYNAYKSANTVSSNYNNIINNNSLKNNNNNINNSKFVVGTKFNGVFKPSTAAATWANGNGNGTANGIANGSSDQNEASKVVLRRPKLADAEPVATTAEDEQVPEFIRRQRRIQERLAKENVLDFENRRSGYFTHVMISPDSPNRTSFVETMASPAIVPALEMPLQARIEEEQQQQQEQQIANGHSEVETQAVLKEESVQLEVNQVSNGHEHAHDDVAAEEVAQAIEEVNKAVAGEDDDSKPETEAEVEVEVNTEVKSQEEPVVPAAVEAHVEVITPVTAPESQSVAAPELPAVQNEEANETITISHTNGHISEEPSLTTPVADANDAQGVNFEPKTVVSFSQELGAGENNYPDVVKVVKEVPTTPAEAELEEMAKLKFDIKSDGQDEVQVTPVLRSAE